MEPIAEQLQMWHRPSDADELRWSWVRDQLVGAATYWVVPRGTKHPHPRPVWGVWSDDTLYVSIGSPRVVAELEADPAVTVHLSSDIDVVIVEAGTTGMTDDEELVAQYNIKYDWDYIIDEYGPLTIVSPEKVIAWRSEGWGGRDGIKRSGRWRFAPRIGSGG